MNWRYRHTVLALAALANFTQLGSRLAISPLVPDVIDAFGVSKATLGLALTGMWAAYALTQFPSGLLGDRYGERRVALVALALLGGACLLFVVVPSFLLFGLVAVVLGAGAGLYYPVAASLLTDLSENVGGALGVMTAGGSAAGLVTPLLAVAVAARFGWRAGVGLGAALALPVLALFAWRVRPTAPARPDERLRDRVDPQAIGALLSRPAVAFTTVLSFVTMFTFQAFASFFPTFLVEYRGMSQSRAGIAFSAVFLLSAVTLPVMGRLSDRVDRDLVLATNLLVAAAGLAVLLVGDGLAAAAAGVLLLGVGVSWAGAMQARLMDAFSAAERGTGFGLVRTVYMFCGAFGSVVTGALAGAAGWLPAYGLVVGLLLCGVAGLAGNRLLDLGL
ncbi:MAG: MFS transporter [Haloarculaceae archaeon]